MDVCGQCIALGFHSVPETPLEVFQQIICLFLCDDAFLQEVSSAVGVNVPSLQS